MTRQSYLRWFAVLPTLSVLCAGMAEAVTSTQTVPAPTGGNGHSVTHDGLLSIICRSSAQGTGWYGTLLRPGEVDVSSGFPDVSHAFSPETLLQLSTRDENALALCEETPQPSRCDAAGNAAPGGDHACYDLYVINSSGIDSPPVMRRRRLKVVVAAPGSAQASIASFAWSETDLPELQPPLRGLEPTISKDGRLLVWQGVPGNNGDIDTLVYSYNSTPCAIGGWSQPASISAMHADPALVGKYKLADKPLRAADGSVFAPTQLFRGAYPWLFPDGDAITFTATGNCNYEVDPPECGARRGALSVIGYPTQWTVGHIDGAVNPSTDTARLFFSSPGPKNAAPLPVSKGLDVWPLFGSNTANYTELVFDDALDGKYAAVWHMNELVTVEGELDLRRSADSSGYANTATLVGGARMPRVNNGLVGKAVILNGTDARVEVAHASSLTPVNQITIEMAVHPIGDPDCGDGNNYRVLLAKGAGLQGSYNLVLEEDRTVRARVRVAGGDVYALHSPTPLPLDAWSRIAVEYDGPTGTMAMFVDGVETARATHPAALLAGLPDALSIGGPLGAAPLACPQGGKGAFSGLIDEVMISRAWRYGEHPPWPDLAGSDPSPEDAGVDPPDGGAGELDAAAPPGDGAPPADPGPPEDDRGCAFGAAATATPWWLPLALLAPTWRRRRTA